MKVLRSPATVFALLLAAAAAVRADDAPAASAFTLGLVQKELRVGMSQTEVVTALGAPNLVTRSQDGREAWVYDKAATDVQVKSSSIGGGGGAFGPAGPAAWFAWTSGRRREDRSVTTQRTLTVVIRFDATGAVGSFAFHASQF